MTKPITHNFKVGDIVLGLRQDSNAALGYVLNKYKIVALSPHVVRYDVKVVLEDVDENYIETLLAAESHGSSGWNVDVHFFKDTEQLIEFLDTVKRVELNYTKKELSYLQSKIERLNAFDVEKVVNDLLSTV